MGEYEIYNEKNPDVIRKIRIITNKLSRSGPANFKKIVLEEALRMNVPIEQILEWNNNPRYQQERGSIDARYTDWRAGRQLPYKLRNQDRERAESDRIIQKEMDSWDNQEHQNELYRAMIAGDIGPGEIPKYRKKKTTTKPKRKVCRCK